MGFDETWDHLQEERRQRNKLLADVLIALAESPKGVEALRIIMEIKETPSEEGASANRERTDLS